MARLWATKACCHSNVAYGMPATNITAYLGRLMVVWPRVSLGLANVRCLYNVIDICKVLLWQVYQSWIINPCKFYFLYDVHMP